MYFLPFFFALCVTFSPLLFVHGVLIDRVGLLLGVLPNWLSLDFPAECFVKTQRKGRQERGAWRNDNV